MHLGTNDYAMNVLDADFYTAYQTFGPPYPPGISQGLYCPGRRAAAPPATWTYCSGWPTWPRGRTVTSAAGHRQLAEQLTAYLKETLNW